MLGIYCVNDNKDINPKSPQIMHCIFCYNIIVLIQTQKFKQKRVYSYTIQQKE